MDEAEQLCDRLVVMDQGKIVAEGSPRDLLESVLDARGGRARFDNSRPEDLGYWTDGLVSAGRVAPGPRAPVHGDGDAAAHGLHERGLVPESVLVRRSTLEDVFLHLTAEPVE